MSKYGERPTHNLAIKATGIGTAEILLNGQDIASALTDLTLTMGVGKVPTATLDLLLIDTTQIQDAETRILIPDSTRDLLVTLGWAPPCDGTHVYLSTSCRHDDHDYCQNDKGSNGAVNWNKMPGECKFCSAPCICPCHQEEPPTPAETETPEPTP